MHLAAIAPRTPIIGPMLCGMVLMSMMLISHDVNAQVVDSEPLERIVEVVRTLVQTTLGAAEPATTQIEIAQLDSRLRLPRCAQIPSAELAPGTRSIDNGTISVRCSAPVAWSILVPVRVEREQEVVVVTRMLARQHIIQPDDVQIKTVSSRTLSNGYFDTLDAVIGLQTKRALNPGEVLNTTMVTAAKLIKRGQQVTLFSSRPGLTVQMKGEALEDGVLGQRIRIRNRTSKQIVEGYVESSGTVRLGL
ncbi:flagellar basal body P-ring formation chaperone FlgA [Chromatium okenii]|uniref:Flagella basal body P-ring formation protein FlgA n=1 Tax=Chromatium okenii TaxID=61644 RepID=A0A2S7XPG0_9GAMM|nr:flagellar basal body P-ring formation chaperone FlgA [Chromatium okenii]PQJ95271.1 flagella basal body P-ring formation protein FlgA [Chromatium okenii]